MTRIDRQSKIRIARAVNTVERLPVTPAIADPTPRVVRHALPWWGITKAVIDNGAAGDVYFQRGSGIAPTTTGLSTYYTVANPWMGKLIIGMPVLVTPAAIESISGGYVWWIQPFALAYEGKVSGSITAGGSGTVDLWEDDAAISPAVTVNAYHRWIASTDLSSGTKVIVRWDIKKRRFVVDAWACA